MSVSGLLQTMLYIADLNAAEVKDRRLSRLSPLTAAEVEELEWAAFQAKLVRQHLRLGDMEVRDEDEAELLMAALEIVKEYEPLTSNEVMGKLQRSHLLSKEFTSSARAQTMILLNRLKEAGKITEDRHGRWCFV